MHAQMHDNDESKVLPRPILKPQWKKSYDK